MDASLLLAARDGASELAQILVFAVIALISLLAKLKRKPAGRPPEGEEHEAEEPEPERAPRPAPRPPGPRRLPPSDAPVAQAPAHRSLVALEHAPHVELPSSGARGPRPLEGPAAVRHAAASLGGRGLLFAKDPGPGDRVRAGLLWREVLGPPLSLDDPFGPALPTRRP